MLTVKELKEKLKDLNDDMEVIVCGENGYGLDIIDAVVEEKGMIYEDGDNDIETSKMLSLKVESYLAESEDLGCMDVYVNAEDLENWNSDAEDVEFDCD